jgi:hypothetical protein
MSCRCTIYIVHSRRNYISEDTDDVVVCDVNNQRWEKAKGSNSIFKPGLVEGFIYLLSKNQFGLKQYKLQTNKKTIKEI